MKQTRDVELGVGDSALPPDMEPQQSSENTADYAGGGSVPLESYDTQARAPQGQKGAEQLTMFNTLPKPFLRWVGGKTRLVKTLSSLAPSDISSGTYWEPFLGAASVFFSLVPPRAVLSDLNTSLIDTYIAVRKTPMEVSLHLQQHLSANDEGHYYRVRDAYNSGEFPCRAAKAAAFIYLNKACFNGIWRVNKEGRFNVPYGHKEPPALPTASELVTVSSALENATLTSGDFRQVLDEAGNGDFAYLDPPYPPLNGTAYFTHYTKARFVSDDQKAVADTARSLDRRGCRVLISNADTEMIRELYEGFHIVPLQVTRWVSANGKRYKVGEVAITNYLDV